MKKTLYFAYGSNMNLEQMSRRCPKAKVVGTAFLEGYELLFRGSRQSAVATIEPKTDSRVPIVIWQITPSDEEALDRYEGFPHLYRKEYLTVDFNGNPTEMMVYIMNEGYNIGSPSCYYYDTIREGYNANGFDTGILKAAAENCKAPNPFSE